MIKWVIRLAAGVVSIVLAISGDAIFKEPINASINPPIRAVPLAIAFILGGGLLTFVVFFRWRLTRVVLSVGPERDAKGTIRRHGRMLAAVLSGFGVLGILVALVAVLGLSGTTSVAPDTIATVVLLMMASLISGGIAVGLWREALWARRAALLSGFLFFGGLPFGDSLRAVSLVVRGESICS